MSEVTWAVVVAAGSGRRFGAAKQYERLAGRRVLDWSLDAARGRGDEARAGVVLVVAPELRVASEPSADLVVAGGATRSASVRAGLAALPADATLVVVHDAARPVPVPGVWRRVLGALTQGADAAVPVVAVADTLRELSGITVDRDRFVAVQTPQGFRADLLRRAHAGEPEGSDDASLIDAIGARVVLVDGDPANIKVTTPVDLLLADLLLAERRHAERPRR